MWGRAGQFRDDLEEYIKFRTECDGKEITPNEVDFEDFMAFLDVEHYLGLRGSDTWSSDGNESQVAVKTLIGEILTAVMPTQDSIPKIYKQFALALRPGDIILTFNYDVLLERALDAIGKPYRLFPNRYKVVHLGYSPWAEVDMSREEVVVLKLHGSIDWFDRRQYSASEKYRREEFNLAGEDHPVFKTSEALRVIPLVDGPRFPDDPLREMHRVLDIERLYSNRILFRATPSLLTPSSAKLLYSQKLRDFWWGMGDVGVLNFRMAIIGFSLSGHDDYARQVLYRLVTNYQKQYWDGEGLPGDKKKTPLLLVDFRCSLKEERDFRERYAFVDWSRAETHFAGFDERLVQRLNDFC
ncbi:MAG: SIR2 family protein [Terriglobia bacterium]